MTVRKQTPREVGECKSSVLQMSGFIQPALAKQSFALPSRRVLAQRDLHHLARIRDRAQNAQRQPAPPPAALRVLMCVAQSRTVI